MSADDERSLDSEEDDDAQSDKVKVEFDIKNKKREFFVPWNTEKSEPDKAAVAKILRDAGITFPFFFARVRHGGDLNDPVYFRVYWDCIGKFKANLLTKKVDSSYSPSSSTSLTNSGKRLTDEQFDMHDPVF
jgi:hypothetical protein